MEKDIPAMINEIDVSLIDIADIEHRQKEIVKLEQDVGIIHELMQDFGFLVQQQTESIDLIQANIADAEVQTEKGTLELVKADGYARKAGRKMKYLLGAALAFGTGVGGLALLLL